MIAIDPNFFLILLGWSVFAPALALLAGWYGRGDKEPRS
jgi:hypothetical protein